MESFLLTLPHLSYAALDFPSFLTYIEKLLSRTPETSSVPDFIPKVWWFGQTAQ